MSEKIVRSKHFRRQAKECLTVFFVCVCFVFLVVIVVVVVVVFSNWVRNVIEKH